MPYNYSKLLGKMKEMGIRQEDLARKIGINPASLNKKLHNDTQFKQSEIQKIMSTIGVPLDEVSAYFFTQYPRINLYPTRTSLINEEVKTWDEKNKLK